MMIRAAGKKDLSAIIRLNNCEAGWVGVKGNAFFETCLNIPFFYVIEEQGKISGFLMAMSQSCDYGSKNFLWFKDRYKRFYYVDRVIIDHKERGKGLGTALYHELLKNRNSVPVVAEVSIDPLNATSIRFHEKLGFKEVGIFSADGKKICRMYKLD